MVVAEDGSGFGVDFATEDDFVASGLEAEVAASATGEEGTDSHQNLS